MLFSFAGTALASPVLENDDNLYANATISEQELREKLTDEMEQLNQYFENQNTSIPQILTGEINRLKELKSNTSSQDEYRRLDNLIKEYNNLLDEYNVCNSGVTTFGIEDPVLSTGVAAIVSYFITLRCELSAELLTHAKENSVEDSIYYPAMTNHMYQTAEYHRLTYLVGTQHVTSGSGEFANSNTVADTDMYYAIHLYKFSVDNSGNITIKDKYDFEYGKKRYEGLAGTAVDLMTFAQSKGVIVPYQVRIV